MNKTALVVLVLLSTVSLTAFARGASEMTGGSWSFGGEPAYSGEPITLTGTLELQQANAVPVLKTGSGQWSLLVRRMHGTDIPVKDGDAVTVSGFEVRYPRMGPGKGMRAFVVQKAVIAGKEYLLSRRHGWRGMMGPFGMMGHHGPIGWADGRFPSRLGTDSCSRWEDFS